VVAPVAAGALVVGVANGAGVLMQAILKLDEKGL